jgi:thioredoxin reductase (NADPH)
VSNAKVVIIGAGPAGIATAIQLKRCGIEPVVFEQKEIGGLLRNANLVENYPGFPGGISGLDLAELFGRQLANAGVQVRFAKVFTLEHQDEAFRVETDEGVFTSSVAVIASGTKPKRIPELNISDGIRDKVFYEIDTLRGFERKRFAIIGAGDAAFDYALSLAKRNEVVILCRGRQQKCIPILAERCRGCENISSLNDIRVTEVNEQGSELCLTCVNGYNQNQIQVCADSLLIAVGREPCLDFLGGQLKRNLEKLIEQDVLYMTGDVKNELFRQTAICVGDGIKAAMKISEKVREANT